MSFSYDPRYPAISDLRLRARRRIPRFAFEYLDGGCNEEINLHKNRLDVQKIELEPRYIVEPFEVSLSHELFGKQYAAPFGIAPIGLQGLIWPNSPEILAKAAHQSNIPFILSTVTTTAIERTGEITEGNFWFQLYHPVTEHLKVDLLRRAEEAGCKVLVLLADTPVFGFRPRDIRNGLAMPPKMTLRNLMQIIGKPQWAMHTLIHGQPNFASLKPYMPKNLNLRQLGKFMNDTFSGRLSESRIDAVRKQWKGKLVIKGLVAEPDVDKAISMGIDGIIVSNHGGRQLDAGQSTIVPMRSLVKKYKNKITIMMDGGLRSGPDVARAMASGADFTFMGRSFMYGAAALGKRGGGHTISLIKTELRQVLQQLGCKSVSNLPRHLIP